MTIPTVQPITQKRLNSLNARSNMPRVALKVTRLN